MTGAVEGRQHPTGWAIGLLVVSGLVLGSSAVLSERLQLMLVVAAAWGIVLILLVPRPEWGVFLLALYIPVEEFAEKWIPRGPVYEGARFGGELMLFVLLLVVVVDNARRGRLWRVTALDIPLLLFLLSAAVSAVLNGAPPSTALLGVRPLLRYVAAFYIMSQRRLGRETYEKWVTMGFVVAGFVAGVGLLQTVVGAPLTRFLQAGDVVVGSEWIRAGVRHYMSDRTFVFSTMGRYDTLGTYLVFFLLVGVGLHALAGGEWRRRSRLLALVGLPALALTFSRQSWLGLCAGLVAISLFAGSALFKKTRLVVLCGLVGLAVFYPTLRQLATYSGGRTATAVSLSKRALEPFSKDYYQVSRYSYGRLYVIVDVGGRLLELAPLLGQGPGRFGSLTSRYLGADDAQLVGMPEKAAHLINDVNWIVVLGQFGLVGVLAYLWMLAALLGMSLSLYRRGRGPFEKGLALGYAGAVVAIALSGFFGPNFEVRQLSFFLWSFGGVIAGLSRTGEQTAGSPPLVETR